MDEAALERCDHGLSSVVNIEPHKDNADMTLDRGFGNAEVGGNFTV